MEFIDNRGWLVVVAFHFHGIKGHWHRYRGWCDSTEGK